MYTRKRQGEQRCKKGAPLKARVTKCHQERSQTKITGESSMWPYLNILTMIIAMTVCCKKGVEGGDNKMFSGQ